MQKLIFRNGNGVEVDFTSGDFGIVNWTGFSEADLNIQTQQVPFNDGSVYLDSLIQDRVISITLAINDEKNLEKRYTLRRNDQKFGYYHLGPAGKGAQQQGQSLLQL